MRGSDTRHPVELIGIGAALAGVLLLVAPWTPPQVAVFAFVGLFLLGTLAYYGLGFIGTVVYTELDHRLPEEPGPYDDLPVDEATMQRYLDGELSDAELEREIERALDRDDATTESPIQAET